MNESLNVLWETETTVAQPGFEKLSADAGVESHGVGDFFHIRADFFAEIGNHVGITDFQREKRIGGVLDEFSAVDSGDEELGFAARGTRSVVHRATETPFENRTVDLAQFRGGGRILDADNNAVGMKKIRNGGGFAKKIRIGGHAGFYVGLF